MKDYMMALHQRFCKEPACREVREQIREIEHDLRQALDRRGQEQLLKLADLENELLDVTSLESFLSGFKLNSYRFSSQVCWCCMDTIWQSGQNSM